jgi:hypothetical protein
MHSSNTFDLFALGGTVVENKGFIDKDRISITGDLRIK